jgi:hypothetical protein
MIVGWLGVVGSVTLGGCAVITAPQAGRSTTSNLAIAEATHEYPSRTHVAQTVRRAAPGAVEALQAFARAYINWSADTVVDDMRALAAESIGQARSAMQLAAAETESDYELQRGGIANSGTVEAVAPMSGRPDQYVVITMEQTTATNTAAYQGLHPAWHLTLATVSQIGPGEWVVSRWQPEG